MDLKVNLGGVLQLLSLLILFGCMIRKIGLILLYILSVIRTYAQIVKYITEMTGRN